MTPSSNSTLPAKKQPTRPLYSLSSRPSSRNTIQRPASSLGTRPASSASTRPQSRFSQRPSSRQARSRLIPICQALVTEVTGLREDGTENDVDGERFRESVDYVLKHLENTVVNKASSNVDLGAIDRRISGLALKARVNSQGAFAEALLSAYQRLKTHIEEREADLDQEIKTSHIPDHLQFLLALNRPPSDVTVVKAKTYLETIAHPPPPPPSLTWADILAEDPFEGEHWEGIDVPGSAQGASEGRDPEEWDTSPSLSPLSSDDLPLEGEDDSFSSAAYQESSESSPPSSPSPATRPVAIPYSYEHRKIFEELKAKQYWRDDWHTDAATNPQFNIGDPSTLGPTLSRVLARASGFQDAHAMLRSEHYIDEDDMTREILMALQGNRSILLTWKNGAFWMTPSTPRLIHLSLASQESIISSLARTASTVQNLRRFASVVFSRSNSSPPANKRVASTRTCEAFADAIDETVRGFDAWCSRREEAMCRAYLGIDEGPLAVSLLGTERAIQDEYESSFDVLLGIVQEVFNLKPEDDFAVFDQNTQTRQPAVLTALLLDTLFSRVQQHMERRESLTSDALMRVFVRTAEPVWNMIGRWLKNGMGLGLGVGTGGKHGTADELDDEFFIESSGIGVGMMGMGLLDPEFWKEGYALREGVASSGDPGADEPQPGPVPQAPVSNRKAIPLFLEHVAEMVLGTGKAVGLMRALGDPLTPNVFGAWKMFTDLVSSETQGATGVKQKNVGLFSVSVDTLSRLIYDELLPYCQAAGVQVVRVLVDECLLWKHLTAIEDLFLMRKGDAMSHFVDVLFTKMESTQSWADFHFLNTAFNDVIEANANAGTKEWVNASLVRFSYRGGKEKDRSIKRTVKAIDGLCLEYAVPFPLTYIFQPKTIQGYNEIFTLLLQIRRAKSVLERILVRDDSGREKALREELKVFYAMRSRLSWFANTLLNFLTTYVIHAEVLRFHEVFRKAESLDEMIQLHDEHLDKIRGRCLLKPNTSALHRAILSILDMCLHFSEGFVVFAGDTTATLDVSRQSISIKRHRSRRQRRQRRDIIGFSQFLHDDDDSSDEDGGNLEANGGDHDEPSFSMTGSSITGEEDFSARVERMSSELDGLVRFLRRGVESLAGGTSEAASAFGVLAFSLEDWDI
ncbi:Spc98 family-domain-containing protein [Gymnopilus junonius]|uniref:Spc98 family-domain-containing protein n=1 Tax=Gymnopilus junonius TaxID=109634 RepID=A0A9P5TV72_GYMJU|nr:Spc98 family-domain-containing protein [Gymnopilus junonius]